MVFWKVGTDSRWSRRYSYVHLPIFTFLGKGRKAFACAKRVHKEETLATFWAGRPITFFLSNYIISKNLLFLVKFGETIAEWHNEIISDLMCDLVSCVLLVDFSVLCVYVTCMFVLLYTDTFRSADSGLESCATLCRRYYVQVRGSLSAYLHRTPYFEYM
jgi:hypothetical protein